ncbi:hypothetical protein ACFE04_030486 [Oxalis oulophora]
MKKCELCKFAAKAYCESDQASLCWDCDARVHAANFLVARHSRTLLCNICQSQTPWTASGAKLGHTVTVCEICAKNGRVIEEENYYSGDGAAVDGGDGEDEDTDGEEEEEGNGEDGEEEEDEDDGENQVVPWAAIGTTPPPPASGCSSADESSGSGFSSIKRMRDQGNVCAHRKLTRIGSEDSFQQPLKNQRSEQDHEHYHRDNGVLTGGSGAVDLNLPASPSR